MHSCWWILFITSLWYKKSTSLPQLYFAISNRRSVTVKDLRQIEKLGYKVLKLRLDVKYLETCSNLNLCPDFLKFKPPKLKVYQNLSDLHQIIVRKKINEVKKELAKVEKQYTEKKVILKQLGIVEKLSLLSLLTEKFQSAANSIITTHRQKQLRLWLRQRQKSPECIINLSRKKKLTIPEEDSLRFGLDNHILPKKLKIDEIKANVEHVLSLLKANEALAIDDDTREDIKFIVKKFMNQGKRLCSNHRNIALHKTLKSLKDDTNIKICKFDKGRGVAILDSDDYYFKLDKIVNDTSKFKELQLNSKTHPIIARENSISYYIRKNLKEFGQDTIKSLIPSGSNPGKIYGLVKVHKTDNPVRPVVSMIGTPEYKLAKFLDVIIKPYMPQTYMLQSTNHFLEQLNNFQFSSDQTVVSFDVSSLFTNVPLEETIQIITNAIYSENNSNQNQQPPIKKEAFIKLLRLATQGIFMHKERFYQQHDGVSMGSPLGPTIANFFLSHLENNILKRNSNFHPKLYLRYVDDIFAVFQDTASCSEFLELLNSQHNNIKFTVEHASETIPFLDVNIKITDSGVDTWIWRKPTHTSLLLNFGALCPLKWKSGLILCLLDRAKRICSSNALFNQEIKKLESMFKSNGYPKKFFDSVLNRFFDRNHDFKSKLEEIPDKRREYYFSVPYLGVESRAFAKAFTRLIKKNLDVKFIPIYKTYKINSYFQLKSKTPLALCSNVVYKFMCSCDTNNTYIGMSSRHLSTRVREHLNFNSLTKSSIKDHIMSCQICSNYRHNLNSFTILRKCRSEFHTKIHEALLIKKHKPTLNRQLYAAGSSFLLQIF